MRRRHDPKVTPGTSAQDYILARVKHPLVRALVACLREIAERQAAERAATRRTMTVIDGKRGGRAA